MVISVADVVQGGFGIAAVAGVEHLVGPVAGVGVAVDGPVADVLVGVVGPVEHRRPPVRLVHVPLHHGRLRPVHQAGHVEVRIVQII
jgi:hypothetical protein